MKNIPVVAKPTLIQLIAARFAVEPDKLLPTLKATAFRQSKGGEISDAQMTALMIVANEYGLNPFTKELYAYPDKQGGIVPVVSVDGWTRIINSNAALNGIEFAYSEETETPPHGKECPIWIECTITRKDREKPITVREYLDECYRAPFKRDDGSVVNGPWQTHTKRFLRHKTYIQCARIAFGFGGIYDDDEAQRIIEKDITPQLELIEGPKSKKAAPETEPAAQERPPTEVPPSYPRGDPAAPGAAGQLHPDLVTLIGDKITEAHWNKAKLLAKYGVTGFAFLSPEQADEIVTAADTRIAELAKIKAGA